MCFTFPWASLSNLQIFEDACNGFMDVCRKCGLQKDSIHIIVLTRGLLAKGKEHSSLSFQSKTSLDIFITLNSLKHLIGM